jgi:hypothetical protein
VEVVDQLVSRGEASDQVGARSGGSTSSSYFPGDSPTADERSSGYGGGDDHGGGYSSYKVPTKRPGPFGPPRPNFKCERSSETLYVTQSKWTFDKKCFTVYKVKCQQGYDTGKAGVVMDFWLRLKTLSNVKYNRNCFANLK